MKKIILLSLLISGMTSVANAKTGPYLGLDINRSKATHSYSHVSGNNSNSDSNVGYSVSAGYNFDFDKFFLAPEIFYDKINTSNKSYLCPDGGAHYCKDKMEIDSRYGAKINLGYEVAPKTRIFINGGYTNVKMDQRYLNGYTAITTGRVLVRSNEGGVFTYGFGASYSLDNNWAIRTSYEISELKVVHQDYLVPQPLDRIKLQIFKLGVVYSF